MPNKPGAQQKYREIFHAISSASAKNTDESINPSIPKFSRNIIQAYNMLIIVKIPDMY